MKIKSIKFVALSVLSIALCFSTTSVVRAQNDGDQAGGSGLSISPLINDPISQLAPGESETLTFTIRNVTNAPVTATGVINDFEPVGESGQPSVILDQSQKSPRGIQDFTGELPSFSLDSLDSREINVIFTAPADAIPGSHYGVVRYVANPVNQQDSNVVLSASVSSIVLIEVDGEQREELSVEQLGAASRGDQEGSKSVFISGDIDVFARLNNTGNTFLQPFGSLTVKNMLGSTVQDYEFNADRANVLPNSIRRFSYPVDSTALPGRYTIESTISYGDGGGKIITSSASFWVLPIWFIVILIVLLLLIIGGGIALTKKSRK